MTVRIRNLSRLALTFISLLTIDVAVGQFQLSEMMASNTQGITDADGDTSDWIEIQNLAQEDQALGGYYLSDDRATLTKWQFPADVTVPGWGYLVIFASGKDQRDPDGSLHTQFRLAAQSGDLLLTSPDGTTIVDRILSYPEQRADVSFGRTDIGGELLYYLDPSPGESATATGVSGFVADTTFDVDRGFFSDPFDVTIHSATPNARIYYTIDGSAPATDTATASLFTSPIRIEGTTILRAIATADGMAPSDIDTQTYLFLSDVLRQDGNGLPTPPRRSISDWDYEMDPEIVDDPRFASLEDDLKALRTLSVVMPNTDLWETSGIYANPTQTGADWERGCSIEILDPRNEQANYQQDGGLRMQGAGSRFRNIGKKSMRLTFRSEYGDGKLRYPLFGETQPAEFDTIVLRGSYFDSWTVHVPGTGDGIGWNNALQFRTDFGHETHRDMGAREILRDWVHLYLNGQYWGIYNIHERPDEEFAALHLGGSPDEYDVLKQRPRGQPDGSLPELTHGDLDAWRELMALVKQDTTDPSVYAKILTRIEVGPFIDYILMNLWGGNQDWPHNNWYAIRHKPSDGPFQFYNWDPENYIFDVNVNQVNVSTDNSPGILFSRLRRNEEFRLLFADHVQRHCFNDGALTPDSAIARFQKIVDYLQAPMNAESARWGDERSRDPLNTLDTWLPVVDDKITDYFPRRTGILLSQLRAAGLYPRVAAPEFNQHGGTVSTPVEFSITAPAGTIYYTLDGSDPMATPRIPGEPLLAEGAPASALVPSVENGGDSLAGRWIEAGFDPVDWITGTTGVGFEAASGYEDLIGLDVAEMHNGNNSVFIRIPFSIADQTSIDAMVGLTLKMKYDDGFVAYLNGVEVAAFAAPTERNWQSEATDSHSDSLAKSFKAFDISTFRTLLNPGLNVLAIHGLNQNNSNDLIILPQLTTDGDAANATVSASATAYTGSFRIDSPTTINARVLDRETWSALTTASFRATTTVPSTANLIITELHYHPAAPTIEEIEAGVNDGERFEFVELKNVGNLAIDLAGSRFVSGIGYTFMEGTVIAAGQPLVLVKDTVAAALRYPGVPVAGEFAGNLSNSGERILLVDKNDVALIDFTYDDAAPWPTPADGTGFSLQRIDESSSQAAATEATTWTVSDILNGTPGTSVTPMGFTGNPDADTDGDGQSALAEYAFGTSDTNPAAFGVLSIHTEETPDTAVLLSFAASAAATGIEIVVEGSADLTLWEKAAVEYLDPLLLPDGRWLLRSRFKADGSHYLRLHVIPAPDLP
ncbi:MAG: CotH kinase family protein [Verrucomicrobiae bacterium]|nr:CotH kinase family protein [Verrucomicrobiae bacterium]